MRRSRGGRRRPARSCRRYRSGVSHSSFDAFDEQPALDLLGRSGARQRGHDEQAARADVPPSYSRPRTNSLSLPTAKRLARPRSATTRLSKAAHQIKAAVPHSPPVPPPLRLRVNLSQTPRPTSHAKARATARAASCAPPSPPALTVASLPPFRAATNNAAQATGARAAPAPAASASSTFASPTTISSTRSTSASPLAPATSSTLPRAPTTPLLARRANAKSSTPSEASRACQPAPANLAIPAPPPPTCAPRDSPASSTATPTNQDTADASVELSPAANRAAQRPRAIASTSTATPPASANVPKFRPSRSCGRSGRACQRASPNQVGSPRARRCRFRVCRPRFP